MVGCSKRWESDYLETSLVWLMSRSLLCFLHKHSILCSCLRKLERTASILCLSFEHLVGWLPPSRKIAGRLFWAQRDDNCTTFTFGGDPVLFWNVCFRSQKCLRSLCTHISLSIKYLFPLETSDKNQTKPSQWLNYQAMIEGGDNKEEQKYEKRDRGEQRRGKKSACLKKLRCYTIVFHNKPKQPLLHQPDCVMRMKKTATKDFSKLC